MATSSAAERLAERVPFWALITLLSLTLGAAGFGWALATYSVPSLLEDLFSEGFRYLGLGAKLGRGVGGLLGFAASLLALVPLFPAIALVADREGESVGAARLRFYQSQGAFWTTFLIQIVLVPWWLGDEAAVRVCGPVQETVSGPFLRLFAFGLVEAHSALFVVLLAALVDGWRGDEAAGTDDRGDRLQAILRWIGVSALLFEAFVLLVLPALVRWWLPVGVCPDSFDDVECSVRIARGFDLTLCEYPSAYVVALYGNIALSLGSRLWSWWRSRPLEGAPDA